MSKVISSQFEIPQVNEATLSLRKEIFEILRLFSYVALPTFLLALTWANVI